MTSRTSDPFVRRGTRGLPLLAGGIGRSAYFVGDPAPYAVRGEGWRLWDDSGKELIDANNNFTTLVHGNATPEIIEAVERVIRDGVSFGIPNAAEWELADQILSRTPSLDQVRFANSGTEAVMTAIRIARTFTGRDQIIVTEGGFHGTSETALCVNPSPQGIPQAVDDQVSRVAVNDIDALRDILSREGERIAAVTLDLLPNKAGLIAVEAEFLREARELTRRYGALLIIDEVISFRLGVGGLNEARSAEADLVTLGKVIGGGFPVGAIAGRQEVMKILDPHVPGHLSHSGTFSGNPVTMAAGVEALRLLTQERIDHINSLGDAVRDRSADQLGELGWELRGTGSLFRPFPIGAKAVSSEVQQRLWWAAYERGLLLSSANMGALSTPMTESVAQEISDRLTSAVAEVAAE